MIKCKYLFPIILLFFSGCARQEKSDVVRLETKVRDLLELHTYEHIYRDIVYYGEKRSFLFIKTVDKNILFSIDVSVRAGIDFKEGFQLLRDEVSDNVIYVSLPPAKVLLTDADEESIRQYFVTESGSEIGLKEISSQLNEIKTEIEKDAVERGILIKAEENAKRVISNFLELAGYSEVHFVPFKPQVEKGDVP
jgi:hypothetical protein